MDSERSYEELPSILALLDVSGLGPVKFKSIYNEFESFSKIFNISEEQIKKTFKFRNSYLFSTDIKFVDEFKKEYLSEELREVFRNNRQELSQDAEISTIGKNKWKITNDDNRRFIFKIPKADKTKSKLSVSKDITGEILRHKELLQDFEKVADEQLKSAEKLNADILTFFNEEYPPILLNSNHSVPILYARGNLELLKNKKGCAVVGTRKPSNWTIKETKKAVKKLVSTGHTIVSGLALGVDSLAHSTALEFKGDTIAVLGCGVDVTYPPENLDLSQEIIDKGIIVSEYPFGTKIQEYRLKKRNKITVGLSNYVLIAETTEKGGTMNSYIAAKEQKKSVGVLYPSQEQLSTFGGNIKVLKETKIPVIKFTDGDDVEFKGETGGKNREGFSF